jgi:NAD(P)-dependent dehydrogenase (short-subunit alcohol dehydrogenase family)
MRLKGKIAIIVGAGQSAGSTTAVGNGRATAIVFAREGAKVLAVDRDLSSAKETVKLIADAGGEAIACAADVVDEAQVKATIDLCLQRWR